MTRPTSDPGATDALIRLVHAPGDAATDAAAPAVLVAAWLLAELADSPAVLVDQVGTSAVHLRPVGAAAHVSALRRRVAALLVDARLAGWTIAAGSDMTRTLLEREARHGVTNADTS